MNSISFCSCRRLPFQEKHVLQQASILGNLEDAGVIKSSGAGGTQKKQSSGNGSCVDDDVPAVVEFGAGRGYLTQMLADCYGIKKVILVERKSYKLKVCEFDVKFIVNCLFEFPKINVRSYEVLIFKSRSLLLFCQLYNLIIRRTF